MFPSACMLKPGEVSVESMVFEVLKDEKPVELLMIRMLKDPRLTLEAVIVVKLAQVTPTKSARRSKNQASELKIHPHCSIYNTQHVLKTVAFYIEFDIKMRTKIYFDNHFLDILWPVIIAYD
jgi:hypothetical protein